MTVLTDRPTELRVRKTLKMTKFLIKKMRGRDEALTKIGKVSRQKINIFSY